MQYFLINYNDCEIAALPAGIALMSDLHLV